ncbi:MAG: histidinol phosphate phosphatase domain-containing protein [Candidatus Hodarchaeaceae archaeon]|nr:histidinol phosphate phosphatase domain-containing protein [Candidatus Hodarchaeaceae archaeon]
MKRIDLHTHSLLSDGELVPSELARRAERLGHEAIAITDHVDLSNIDWVVPRIAKVAAELNRHMDIRVVPGAELTHVPIKTIAKLARLARRLGAELVVVHGETLVEPVHEGTNDAALSSSDVNILAHPGLLTQEQADRAHEGGIYLELTSRQGHCMANGWIARTAMESKAKLLVNTDAHTPDELLTLEEALRVARGAGLSEGDAQMAVVENPKLLLEGL